MTVGNVKLDVHWAHFPYFLNLIFFYYASFSQWLKIRYQLSLSYIFNGTNNFIVCPCLFLASAQFTYFFNVIVLPHIHATVPSKSLHEVFRDIIFTPYFLLLRTLTQWLQIDVHACLRTSYITQCTWKIEQTSYASLTLRLPGPAAGMCGSLTVTVA